MEREKVDRLGSVDALYHAAHRYERDPLFREIPHGQQCPYNPSYVAACLRETANRIEAGHADKTARLRGR